MMAGPNSPKNPKLGTRNPKLTTFAHFFLKTAQKGMKKRFLITSALPYANGPLHIGHLAGAYLPADIFARWLRLMGKEVVFVCGSDEHGAAITMRAITEGTTPQAIVDKYDAMLRDTFQKIGISFDIYHRTSAAIHHETSQDFFRELLKKGQFDVRENDQLYDETAHQFLADRYVVGPARSARTRMPMATSAKNAGRRFRPPISSARGRN